MKSEKELKELLKNRDKLDEAIRTTIPPRIFRRQRTTTAYRSVWRRCLEWILKEGE